MGWRDGLRQRIRGVAARRRMAAELDEELAFHLEREAAKLVKEGWEPAAAGREARRRLGGLEQTREASQRASGAPVLEDAWRDARLAMRALRRRPGHAWSTAVVLALALGAALVSGAVATAYLMRPLPFPRADDLMFVAWAGPQGGDGLDRFGFPLGLDDVLWDGISDIADAVVAWDLDGFAIMGSDEPESVNGAWVTPDFFDVVGAVPALGRGLTAEDARPGAEPVVVLSHGLWQRRFGGDPGIVGTQIQSFSVDRPSEAESMTVVGVLAQDFWYFNRFYDVLAPLRGTRTPSVLRLASGVTPERAVAVLEAVVRSSVGQTLDPRWSPRLTPMRDEHVRDARPTLLLLLATSGLVLTVALVNVSVLLAVRARARARELAVQRALGAGPGRLLRQLAVEGIVLTGASALLGVLLASITLSRLSASIALALSTPVPGGNDTITLNAGMLVPLLLAVLVFGGLLGVLPAYGGGANGVARGLKSGGWRGPRAGRLRSGFIATEIAISLALMVGAGLMVRSAHHLRSVDLGFDPDRTLTASVFLRARSYPDETARLAFAHALLQSVRAEPGVEAAALQIGRTFAGAFGTPLLGDGEATVDEAQVAVVSGGYFEARGIPLLSGRTLALDDEDVSAAVVGEGLAARLWPGLNPLGRRVRARSAMDPRDLADVEWYEVVGVVGDVREGLTLPDLPDVYLPLAADARAFWTIVVRTRGEALGVSADLRRAIWAVDATLPISGLNTMEARVLEASADSRLLAALLSGFALFAGLLALFGLYAVVANIAVERRREVAVRRALGATELAIQRLVFRESRAALLGGLALGLVLAMALARVIAGFLHGVPALDPVTFLAVPLVVLLGAGVAVWVPARRAARTHPALVLRED